MDKSSYQMLSDVSKIDLNYHTLIEASAGTGKTYTIENLVLRFLIEKENIKLENILIVTFTEKATHELKFRIREKLSNTIDCNFNLREEVKKKIKTALDSFDEAQIFTIHGFCNAILRDFPFQVGTLFNQLLVDDKRIFENFIKKQMIQDWPNLYKDKLNQILLLSNFDGHKQGFISEIVKLALTDLENESRQKILPNCKDVDLDGLWSSIINNLNNLRDLVGENRRLSHNFSKLNINKRSKKALLREIIIPLEDSLSNLDPRNPDLSIIFPLVRALKSKVKSDGRTHRKLVPEKWLKAGDNLKECPNLPLIDAKITKLMEYLSIISNLIYIQSVKRLLKDAKAFKLLNGLVSYKDMLKWVESFLYSDMSFHSLNMLRDKYKVAFVDEFQDTDYLQWRIFKKIFLETSKDKQNQLFLIGDPKQAIYSFRGADVFTYFEAKKEIENLAISGYANLYQLAKNWRSTPKLQQAFNSIFSSKYWFEEKYTDDFFGIMYTDVTSPDVNELPEMMSPSYFHSMHIVDLTKIDSVKKSKLVLAEFICKEIDLLINKSNIEIVKKNGNKRKLTYNDICILIRGNPDFNILKPILLEKKIPYSYYKENGLFQSMEADHLSLIFHAILEPERFNLVKLALITPFFDVPIEDINKQKYIPWNHPVNHILLEWGKYAEEEDWGNLFQSIMKASGFIVRHSVDADWDRVESKLYQIFEYLELVANEKKMTFFELVHILDKFRFLPEDELGDNNLHYTDPNKAQVQVMTMHASKGLEFPVVFIAGGLTTYYDSSITVYHERSGREYLKSFTIVKDLTGETGRKQHLKERNDEEKRLFYVAMTRARFKLYVPYYPVTKKMHWVGPICRFISTSIGDVFQNSNDLGLDLKWCTVDPDIQVKNLSFVSHSDHKLYDHVDVSMTHCFPNIGDFRTRTIELNSFSSIVNHNNKSAVNTYLFNNRLRSQPKQNKNYLSFALKTFSDSDTEYEATQLPGGTKIGSMFHDILEKISFGMVYSNPNEILSMHETRAVIENYMFLYNINQLWIEDIAKIIVNTLTTPIWIGTDFFFLGQLLNKFKKHEVEFCFPFDLIREYKVLPIPECNLKNEINGRTFVHGFIDMLFNFKGKTYIVDWKSNRLDCYERSSLEVNMKQYRYDIQYKLYTLATIKWLKKIIGNNFDYNRHFGGVFYFYLRGIGSGGKNGIYHITRDQIGDNESLEKDIVSLIKTSLSCDIN